MENINLMSKLYIYRKYFDIYILYIFETNWMEYIHSIRYSYTDIIQIQQSNTTLNTSGECPWGPIWIRIADFLKGSKFGYYNTSFEFAPCTPLHVNITILNMIKF